MCYRSPRPHTGDELHEHERLPQIIVRAELQPVDAVVDVGCSGEHEHPRAATGHLPAHPVTVHYRQVAVEHDNVVGRFADRLERRRAVVHGVHSHPGLAQPLGHPVGKGRVVLDDKHSHHTIERLQA